MPRFKTLLLGSLMAAVVSSPAMAAHEPVTRLVACGTQSCLLVSGQRADSAVPVSINGHVVATDGTRNWRVRVPVATIRAWSALHARTISVTVADVSHEASLPVGMLGPAKELAMLVVRVK